MKYVDQNKMCLKVIPCYVFMIFRLIYTICWSANEANGKTVAYRSDSVDVQTDLELHYPYKSWFINIGSRSVNRYTTDIGPIYRSDM